MIPAAMEAVVAALILLVVWLGIRRVLRRKRAIEESWGDEAEARGSGPDAG
jgi:hypothetical protein